MTHPLVDQFRFSRGEWRRGLRGLSAVEARRHFGQMNCISWIVGHLAWHEQRTFLQRPHDLVLFASLNDTFAFGAPMSAPSMAEMQRDGGGSRRLRNHIWTASRLSNCKGNCR